jgi:anti-sigma-K factor RskA
MNRPLPHDERLLDLLAERATRGLAPSDEQELRQLLVTHDGIDADELALAAAAADRAFDLPRADDEPLPASLRAAVIEQAADHLPAAAPTEAPQVRRGRAVSPWPGWLAAAAMLVVALGFALRQPGSTVAPTVTPPDITEQRESLLQTADAIRVAWAVPEDPAYRDVRGDVVWSNGQQAGFMRLEGLPVNDPTVAQYQLWIVDPSRDERPVDGGVFDVTAEGEAIIQIDAKLEVREPTVFAITLEQPGGVVVSDGPLLVVAPVTG